MSHPLSKENVDARIPKIRARLESSASGYVLVRKVGTHDRTVLRAMINIGEAEIFDSPLGRAYRLISRSKIHVHRSGSAPTGAPQHMRETYCGKLVASHEAIFCLADTRDPTPGMCQACVTSTRGDR